MTTWLELIGMKTTAFLREMGAVLIFLAQTLRWTVSRPFYLRNLLKQMEQIGVNSVPVVLTTAISTGMVLALQSYTGFKRFGAQSLVGAVVSLSMTRELGPVLTGLMVAGRAGAAMAAELGTMRVTEQIDALRTLATHPVDYLVVPRLLATLIAMPLLTAEAIAIGIGAAYVLGTGYLGIQPAYAWHNMVKYTQPEDVVTGLIKSLLYGGCIALISCDKGMNCREGAEGVGRATTEAVVSCCITILISNFFLTLFLNRVLGG